LQNSNISSEEMTRRIKEWKEQRNDVAKEAEKMYASVMGKGMAEGGSVDFDSNSLFNYYRKLPKASRLKTEESMQREGI
jgi:hypothetical protein